MHYDFARGKGDVSFMCRFFSLMTTYHFRWLIVLYFIVFHLICEHSNVKQTIVEACNRCLREKKDLFLQIDTNDNHMYFKEFMIIYEIPIDCFCN